MDESSLSRPLVIISFRVLFAICIVAIKSHTSVSYTALGWIFFNQRLWILNLVYCLSSFLSCDGSWLIDGAGKGVLFDVCGHHVVICNNEVVVFRLLVGGDGNLFAYGLNGVSSNVLLYVLLWLWLVVIAQRLVFPTSLYGIVESYGGFLLKFVMVVLGCWLLDVAAKVSFGLGGLCGLSF